MSIRLLIHTPEEGIEPGGTVTTTLWRLDKGDTPVSMGPTDVENRSGVAVPGEILAVVDRDVAGRCFVKT